MILPHVPCSHKKKILWGKLCFDEKIKGERSHCDFYKHLIILAVLRISTDILIVLFSVKLDLSYRIELLM